MKMLNLLIAGALLLGACSSAPKKTSDASGSTAAANLAPGAVGPGDKKSPVMVGPDIVAPLSAPQVWAVLAGLDNWGAWNPKVTKVNAGPGLNVGTELRYGWEEREVKAIIEEVKENELLTWKGARTGDDVLLRWQLSPMGVNTVVSLRAVLRPGAGATPIANAGVETNHWIGALQIELRRLADDAVKSKKKTVKKAVSKP